jgi:neuronal cell adhesion molecule
MENESGSLVFTKLTNDDEGEYECYAENDDGIAKTNKIILRRAFLESFKNVSIVQEIVVNEGDSFKFECKVPRGEPKPNIFWMIQTSYGGIKSVESSHVTLDPEGNLWFTSVSRSDSTKDSFYVCSAASNVANEYKLGNRISLKVLPRTKLQYQKPTPPTPQYVSSSNITALSGQNVEFFCIYEGRPTPTITWSKNGSLIENVERIFPENFGKSLKIKKVAVEDEASYECQAMNEKGDQHTTRFALTVETLPRFIVEPETRNVTENELVKIECEVEGRPKPQIEWFYNGKALKNEVNKNRIILKSVTKSNAGNYACYAKNKYGFIFKDISINIVHSSR